MEKMKFARFGSIFFINLGVKELVDLGLNPVLMVEFGFFISLFLTTLIYLLIGIISVWLYDQNQGDLLGLEDWKDNKYLKTKPVEETRLARFINFVKKWEDSNKNLLGLLMSFKNSGLYVIYSRPGAYLYNGFSGKNIKLTFFLNLLIVNIYWNTILFIGIPIGALILGLLYDSWNYWVDLYKYAIENVYGLSSIF